MDDQVIAIVERQVIPAALKRRGDNTEHYGELIEA